MQHERRNGDATIYAWVGGTSAAGVRRRGGENIVTASVRADETNEEQEKKAGGGDGGSRTPRGGCHGRHKPMEGRGEGEKRGIEHEAGVCVCENATSRTVI